MLEGQGGRGECSGEPYHVTSATTFNYIETSDNNKSIYNVKLEQFEGPLDLLLFLIKKNELDICDIPIALITKQYLEYLNLMKELNLEVAGEFLVMASTLIQIKSSLLLPGTPEDADSEESEDPRTELIRRLQEYSRYKEAALQLSERRQLGRDFFARTFSTPEMQPPEETDDPLELDLYDLIEAFRRIVIRAPKKSFHEVSAESISIAERINEILSILQDRDTLAFDDLFEDASDSDYVVATFLALLELCKIKMIKIRQNSQFGSIWIQPAVVEDAARLTVDENAVD
jgi:segregation and condensation protein A